MIQRIQSIYLFLAGILVMLMYTFPLAIFNSNSIIYELLACHIKNPVTGNLLVNVVPMAVLPLLSLFLSFFALVKFKNRIFQMKLGKLNMIVLVALVVVEVIYFLRIESMLEVDGKPGFSAIIPLVSLLLILMANKAIKKDDNLIKSADRIR